MSAKRNWIMVTQWNHGLLREAFCHGYIPRMRVGDQLPINDRRKLAEVLRYWRRVRRFRGPSIHEIIRRSASCPDS